MEKVIEKIKMLKKKAYTKTQSKEMQISKERVFTHLRRTWERDTSRFSKKKRMLERNYFWKFLKLLLKQNSKATRRNNLRRLQIFWRPKGLHKSRVHNSKIHIKFILCKNRRNYIHMRISSLWISLP